MRITSEGVDARELGILAFIEVDLILPIFYLLEIQAERVILKRKNE